MTDHVRRPAWRHFDSTLNASVLRWATSLRVCDVSDLCARTLLTSRCRRCGRGLIRRLISGWLFFFYRETLLRHSRLLSTFVATTTVFARLVCQSVYVLYFTRIFEAVVQKDPLVDSTDCSSPHVHHKWWRFGLTVFQFDIVMYHKVPPTRKFNSFERRRHIKIFIHHTS